MSFGLKLSLTVIVFFVCSCSSTNPKTPSEPVQAKESKNNFEISQTQISSEPLTITGEFPVNLRKKWHDFTANGRYRLAQISDMSFSDNALNQLPGKGASARFYDYAWGDLNYSKRISDDHLAAIVVDTSKINAERFSLVIFSPTKTSKDKYDTNWLYVNKDLSKTIVYRASGNLFIETYADNGLRKACSVDWNKQLKKFECN